MTVHGCEHENKSVTDLDEIHHVRCEKVGCWEGRDGGYYCTDHIDAHGGRVDDFTTNPENWA